MNGYKRLTKWSELGTLHIFDFNGKEISLYDVTSLDCDNLAGRLSELEDKIESGELCDGAQLEQVKKDRDKYKHRAEVADIVISELRAKLSKAEHDRDRYARRITLLLPEKDRGEENNAEM